MLVEAKAAQRALAAHECRTWGEHARLVGVPWEDFLDEWLDELIEINGGTKPDESSPFRFVDLKGLRYVADLVSDPRDIAHDLCWKIVGKRCDENPSMARQIHISSGPPLGHVSCITSATSRGFSRLAELLREVPKNSISLTRDDALIGRCLVGDLA